MIFDLLPNEDQTLIRDSAAAFFSEKLPANRLRNQSNFAAGAELKLWREINELGVFGLGVSSNAGGLGCTIIEEALVAVELGRNLASPSLLATMLAAHIAPPGDARAAFVNGAARASFANARSPLQADASADLQLLDAENTDYILFWQDKDAYLIPQRACENASELAGIDETISMTRVTCDLGAAATKISEAWFKRHAILLLSAYGAGIAQATCAMAVEYAKTREQFGQPIGAFQAIKHYCADMAVRAEGAYAQTFYAAIDATQRSDENIVEAACARLLSNQAALTNARYNIQIHGGMGFTEEADAHLFLKRGLVMASLAGGERRDQMRVMEA